MLQQLTATHFRNLAPLAWSPGPGHHLLLGDNGAGKTSLLEAVYVAATTKSFRTPRLAECRRHGEGSFFLQAEAEGRRRQRLEVSWSAPAQGSSSSSEGGGLDRRLDGSTSSLAEHLSALSVLAWTSADLELLTGPPSLRRRFLDRGVVGSRPAALEPLQRYRQALGQKRRLLLEANPDHRGLAAWNELLAPAALEVMELRQRFVRRLEEHLRRVLVLCELGYPAVRLQYRPSPAGERTPEALLAALEAAAPEERRRRRPLVGPHRDELRIAWGGTAVKRVASAGEKKALGLALLAAQGRVLAEVGREPLYLLDDADAELSETTLESVWKAFAGSAQLMASSNRPAAWKTLALNHTWQLSRGTVSGTGEEGLSL